MRIVLPFGVYTAGNTGDEATISGFACLLREMGAGTSGVWVGSRRPSLMPRAEPAFSYFGAARRDLRRYWAKSLASVHAIVGATPILDAHGDGHFAELTATVRASARRGARIGFVGVGVERLARESNRNVIRDEFSACVQQWSARSTAGRNRLLEYGVPANRVLLAADLAWLIAPAGPAFGKQYLAKLGVNTDQPLIGVNIASELFTESPSLARSLAATLDTLISERNANVLFFAHDVTEAASGDLRAAQDVISTMKQGARARVLPNEYLTPRQFMSVINCCELAFGMRYHFCVYAALERVPFVAIQNTDKVVDLCDDMGWSSHVVAPTFDAAELTAHAAQLRAASNETNHLLSASVDKMRTLALKNADALNALRTQ